MSGAGRGPRDVVAKEGFEALLGARGIDQDADVVLYGGNKNWLAVGEGETLGIELKVDGAHTPTTAAG